MSKKKTVTIADEQLEWGKMAASMGAKLLEDLEPVRSYIDTGILALNFVCSGKFVGGGIPSGRVIEIFGDSSSGKSLVGTNILKGTQTCGGVAIMLDAEYAMSKEFAVRASKVDPARFIVIEADTLEQGFSKINNAIRTVRQEWKVPIERPIVIIYDSLAASPSEREFAETTLDLETATKTQLKEAGAGSDKPGERAKVCSKELRKLPKVLDANNASVVFINQVRQKIGVMFGDDTTTAGGGRALEYYASLRLRMRSNKVPKDKKGNVIGVNVSVTNVKNKCFKPFVEASKLHLFFDQGINPFGGLLQLFVQHDRIAGGHGNFTVNPQYSDGKEVKFKSAVDRNDVPLEVLLECPKLVDAETPEQVQYYADLYKSAIDTVEHGIAKEEDVNDFGED